MKEDAGAAALHWRRSIVADDDTELILRDLAHVLGAFPVDGRSGGAIDDSVVVYRRSVIHALG